MAACGPHVAPSGSSSVGRASAFQAECREFESRLPLHVSRDSLFSHSPAPRTSPETLPCKPRPDRRSPRGPATAGRRGATASGFARLRTAGKRTPYHASRESPRRIPRTMLALDGARRAPVAQWIEQPPSKRSVEGSNPSGCTTPRAPPAWMAPAAMWNEVHARRPPTAAVSPTGTDASISTTASRRPPRSRTRER